MARFGIWGRKYFATFPDSRNQAFTLPRPVLIRADNTDLFGTAFRMVA